MPADRRRTSAASRSPAPGPAVAVTPSAPSFAVSATNSSSLRFAAPLAIDSRARSMPSPIDAATVRRVERGAGIQRDDVARRAPPFAERLEHHRPDAVGILDLEAAVAHHAQAEVLGMDLVFADFAVLQLADHRRGAERHLVHAVLAVDDQHVACAEAAAARAPGCRPGRGGTRPAAGSRAPAGLVSGPRMLKIVRTPSSRAHRRGVLHRAVVRFGANMKPTPISAMQVATCSGRQDRCSRRAPRARRRCRTCEETRAVAVLGHARAGRRRDEHRRRSRC